MAELSRLPGRLFRRLAAERAQQQLERDFEGLLETRADAYQTHTVLPSGPKVGFATFGSGNWHFVLEALLAHALALRGARPELLICDMPTLPICDERTIHSRNLDRCTGCVASKRPLLDVCGLPWRGVTDLVGLTALDRARAVVDGLKDEELAGYEEAGWPIGRWLHVSACHFLRCDGRGDEPEKVDARRRLLTSAIVVVKTVQKWLDEVQPDIVIAESGAHFMWRIAFELARARGIRVVCREMGKGGWDSHIYALDADSMSPDLTEAWAEARDQALSESEQAQVEAYLESLPSKTYVQKRHGVGGKTGDLRRALGLPAGKKVAVLFTNVTWDLATAGRDVAFEGVFDWVRESIRAVGHHPDVHLVIRAHPAEASVLTRERILDQIKGEWPAGLPHVTLVPPEHDTSVRDLCEIGGLVLAYNSTTGIEAAVYNKTVLVCGAPHYRGMGFTIDMFSRQEYVAAIERWATGEPLPPPPDASEFARRYFHLFFLRYHVPMGWTTSPLEPPYRLTIKTLAELQVGRNCSLDVVCSGLLGGRQILMPRLPAVI